MRLFWVPLVLILFVVTSCGPFSKKGLRKSFIETEQNFRDHTGFILYDPETGKTLFDYQSNRYFTPASNTKILTLYACVILLGDSIPALQYTLSNDTLHFSGTGDPSFLYRNVHQNFRTFDFLSTTSKALVFHYSNIYTTHFGPGWSWEDYAYPFSSERTSFPVYGNAFDVVFNGKSVFTIPRYFESQMAVSKAESLFADVTRSPFSNETTYFPGTGTLAFTRTIPFHSTPQLIGRLLSDTLNRSVAVTDAPLQGPSKTFFSVPVDSVYKEMMVESDNFIAEQLLLICSSTLSDSLKPEIAITHMLDNELQDLPDQPVWVDGSGLSRYNLTTPRSVVMLWNKLYNKVPRERLFSWLAVGGKSGTLRNSYTSDSPYIFGKTGTLSNVHCLSGFLLTKSGRTLIFSFMNNNYTEPTREIRKRMEQILAGIRDHF